MARTPIARRRGFFEPVNRNSPITRVSDYQVVEFSEPALLYGVEPRSYCGSDILFKVVDQDLQDIGCDTFEFKPNQDFINDFQGVHNIQQTLRDFSF